MKQRPSHAPSPLRSSCAQEDRMPFGPQRNSNTTRETFFIASWATPCRKRAPELDPQSNPNPTPILRGVSTPTRSKKHAVLPRHTPLFRESTSMAFSRSFSFLSRRIVRPLGIPFWIQNRHTREVIFNRVACHVKYGVLLQHGSTFFQ